MVSSAITYWDETARRFAAHYETSKGLRWWLRRGIDLRAERALDLVRPGDAVLDVGCGPGRQVAAAAARGASQVVGVDPAPQMLALAREATRDIESVELHAGGVDAIEARPAFDIVWALGVFDYVDDGESLLAAMAARSRVIAVGRRRDALEAVVARCGGGAVAHVADLARAEEVEGLLNAWPDLSMLVNAAGATRCGHFAKLDWPDAERIWAVNARAPLRLCAHHVPRMVERGRGFVLNVASTAAFGPAPGFAAYGSAKACVLTFSRSLALEVEAEGVVVRCVVPGPMATGFRAAAGLAPRGGEGDPEAVADYAVGLLSRPQSWGVPGLVNQARRWTRDLAPDAAWRGLARRQATGR